VRSATPCWSWSLDGYAAANSSERMDQMVALALGYIESPDGKTTQILARL
jgi:hypothetical protein